MAERRDKRMGGYGWRASRSPHPQRRKRAPRRIDFTSDRNQTRARGGRTGRRRLTPTQERIAVSTGSRSVSSGAAGRCCAGRREEGEGSPAPAVRGGWPVVGAFRYEGGRGILSASPHLPS